MYLSLGNTKAIVMDAFKDVHTGLGILGPPLHCSMKHNVTPIQGHSHRCPVAKKQRQSHVIGNLEKQDILKKITAPTAWISNSVYREKVDGGIYVCVSILTKQLIKPLKSYSNPSSTVDKLLPKLNEPFSCMYVCIQEVHKH